MMADTEPRRTTAHAAFWLMTRRVTVLAACVDTVFFGFFLWVDSPALAWLNVLSIAMYAVAYRLLVWRRNAWALALIWTEVLGHAVVGTLLAGWEAGFNYYLLMFIPATMVSGSWRAVSVPLSVLFITYLGLYGVSSHYGALDPLRGGALMTLYIFNVSIFFGMASYTARFYYIMVRRIEGRLRAIATQDMLTGLFNRRHLIELAQRIVARPRRDGEPVSLVIADIDDFKQINDRLGHDTGDLVLTHVARVLRESCRAQDTVARWGGEEFLFLLPATDSDSAVAFAERVRTANEALRIDHMQQPITCTVSLGVATLEANESLEDAIVRADRALYQSKARGRNRVTAAQPAGATAHDAGQDAPGALAGMPMAGIGLATPLAQSAPPTDTPPSP